MRRGRPETPLTLTEDEHETLERWARRPTTAQALAQRARIVLACVSGRDDSAVAVEARVTRQTVGRWRRRFVDLLIGGQSQVPTPPAAPPARASFPRPDPATIGGPNRLAR
jgi:hypothetical protein